MNTHCLTVVRLYLLCSLWIKSMYYLVQAMEDHTDRVLHSFTKLFSSKAAATAYASLIVANKCGFDFAEITKLDLDSDQFELCSTVA